MPICVFDKCCCCIDLRIGCFVIAYLNFIGLFIYTILSALVIFAGVAITGSANKEKAHEGIATIAVGGIFLIILLVALVFAIILLIGLLKNKPSHLKAFMVFTLIFLVVMVIQLIVSLLNSKVQTSSIVQSLVHIVAECFYLVMINSMYFQMKNPAKGPAFYAAA